MPKLLCEAFTTFQLKSLMNPHARGQPDFKRSAKLTVCFRFVTFASCAHHGPSTNAGAGKGIGPEDVNVPCFAPRRAPADSTNTPADDYFSAILHAVNERCISTALDKLASQIKQE